MKLELNHDSNKNGKLIKNNFKTPILFLVFNRPDTTIKVFNEIQKIKPKKLYIAADGPRDGNINDEKKCNEVKELIFKNINWNCEIKSLLRENNLGCKKAVSSAIDWFFESEEMGIILEDDCVPHQDFFYFCEKLLNFYKNDTRVMMICGTNYLGIDHQFYDDYFFSKFYIVWGWATWKRAWKYYDVEMLQWPNFKENKNLNNFFYNIDISSYYEGMFDLLFYKKFNTWDIQWWFSCISQSAYSILPKYNLITNLGEIGTHSETQKDLSMNLPTKSFNIDNIKKNKFFTYSYEIDKLIYMKLGILQKNTVKNKVKKIFKKIIPKKIQKFLKSILKNK